MTDYSPPTENLPIFDPVVFLSGEEYITQNQADKRYLRYPNAQGKETLQAVDVNGVATFKSTAQFDSNIVANSFISFKDNIAPFTNNTTAYKSVDNLVIQGQQNNSGLVVINKDGTGNNEYTINANTSLIQLYRPIRMNNPNPTQRSIMTSFLQLTDITNPATYNNDFQMYQSNPNTTFSNTSNGGAMVFAVRDSLGVTKTPINFNSQDLQLTTVNTPTISATIPSADDSSTKIATTAWVNTKSGLKDTYLYPQKWLSNLSAYLFSGSYTLPSYTAQSVDIVLPYDPSMTDSGTPGLAGASVRFLVTVGISGLRTTSTDFSNIYCGSMEFQVHINLRNVSITKSVIIAGTNSATTGPSTTANGLNSSTTCTIWNSVTNAVGSQAYTPINVSVLTTAGNKNRVRISFSQFSAIAGLNASIYSQTRSIEILSSSLNIASTSSNSNTWNVMTFPNISSSVTGSFASGTQNIPAYIEPVSTAY